MSKGFSIHIGLNKVNPTHYDGWNGKLTAAEFDAKDMQKLAKSQGFKTQTLLTKAATHKAVLKAIGNAAKSLKRGDILFLTYSGHGGQVPDQNGDETEDYLDETWVLYDRELVDDELFAMWSNFEAGVRIVVLSDSCHSGSVVKMIASEGRSRRSAGANSSATSGPRVKAIPSGVQARTYRNHKKMYDKVQRDYPKGERVSIGASVILISGCQDNQESLDGVSNGLFTSSLLGIWRGGKFKGSYRSFHKAILRKMPDQQSPKLFKTGKSDSHFELQKPFSI